MKDLEFFMKQKERIEEAIAKLDPVRHTQKFVNLMGCGTNLVGFCDQLERLEQAKAEALKREQENAKAAKEAQKELKKKNK